MSFLNRFLCVHFLDAHSERDAGEQNASVNPLPILFRTCNMNPHSRWYDGFLYDKFISPLEHRIYDSISSLVAPGSTVIDVGCGAGNLAFKLQSKCRQVTGVDQSASMIAYASAKKERLGLDHVQFICAGGETLSEMIEEPFDFSVLTMCLHEMDDSLRRPVAKSCLKISKKLIIADYIAVTPKNFTGLAEILIESVGGGPRHYRNFRHWQGLGGIDGFIAEMNLKTMHRTAWKNGIGATVLVSC